MKAHRFCVRLVLLVVAAQCLALASTVDAEEPAAIRRLDFVTLPKDWDVRGVPGRPKALFEGGFVDGTNRVLRMTSDKATAALKSSKLGIDLTRTPIMRWRWKAVALPAGADGRNASLDDQAIGLYVSTGGMMRQKSVAYRWETDTPKGAEGRAKYAAGVVSIYWRALRNKEDLASDGWHIEEVNVAEDFQKAFGEVPTSIGLGVSCNSQFTGTKAEALLDWLEFLPAMP